MTTQKWIISFIQFMSHLGLWVLWGDLIDRIAQRPRLRETNYIFVGVPFGPHDSEAIIQGMRDS